MPIGGRPVSGKAGAEGMLELLKLLEMFGTLELDGLLELVGTELENDSESELVEAE